VKNDAHHIAMVAGEASGDLLASLLLQGVRKRLPGLITSGIGGPRMAQHGFDARWPIDKLAVRGFVEVLRHYHEITGIRRELRRSLLAHPPDLFIGVDAPDFNLELERDLRRHGIPTLHFVSPSIWAWRGKRIEKIREAVSHMLVLFPFEVEIYERAGIPATYVGHPLADVIPLKPDRFGARLALGIESGARVVALLPGSRLSEIRHIAPLFIAAARHILEQQPDVRFFAPMAGAAALSAFNACLENAGPVRAAMHVLSGQSHPVLAACDAALVGSGTATLEAALFKRPMVISYHMPWLSWQLTQMMRYQPWVGLPNILAGEFLVPELLQEAARPLDLARAVLFQLRDADNRRRLEQRFLTLHETLRQDTASRGAAVVMKMLAQESLRTRGLAHDA